MKRCLGLLLLLVTAVRVAAATNEPFAIRGYYTTFMRMPTFGLTEWKQMIDCMREDGANFLILWTAGGFRSKDFPITWQYNAGHKNVEHDYARELIDYAHSRQIKVVLGFTPFGYDGANQYPLEHPELKATQKTGQPANLWGMHAWGYNLCPANELPVRVNRIAYREWTRQPTLTDSAFHEILGRELFGPTASAQVIQDALYVKDCWFNEADWFKSPRLHRPADLQRQAEREQWPAERMRPYLDRVNRLREIEQRHGRSSSATERQLHDVSEWIVREWDEAK